MGRHATTVTKCRIKINMLAENGTYQDDGQESEQGRPDPRIHRKRGETLQNVCRTCAPAFICVLLLT